jgi:hypothetical protein
VLAEEGFYLLDFVFERAYLSLAFVPVFGFVGLEVLFALFELVLDGGEAAFELGFASVGALYVFFGVGEGLSEFVVGVVEGVFVVGELFVFVVLVCEFVEEVLYF